MASVGHIAVGMAAARVYDAWSPTNSSFRVRVVCFHDGKVEALVAVFFTFSWLIKRSARRTHVSSTELLMTSWPKLSFEAWVDTGATLHMWTQVVGKICLALTARTNHFWNIAFQVTSRGLTTPTMTAEVGAFSMAFDFVSHHLAIVCSDGCSETIRLEPHTVADFYRQVMDSLRRLGIHVKIWTLPVEVPNPIRFEADTVHRSYDPVTANAVWRAMLVTKPIFERFRAGFIGKCSPVHFFWGSFDLAVTRFSGRRAPDRPGADSMTRESYSHEVISHGFWPGGGAVKEAVFYAYAAPEPAGYKEVRVRPAAALYLTDLGEFMLPYEAARTSASPEGTLTEFLESTYTAAADLAKWSRHELERSQ